MARKTKSRRGHYQAVDVIPPACMVCGSTEREGYQNVKTLEICGTTPNGQAYTRIAWKRTKCKNCGQHRIDRVFENPKLMSEARTKAAPKA